MEHAKEKKTTQDPRNGIQQKRKTDEWNTQRGDGDKDTRFKVVKPRQGGSQKAKTGLRK